MADCNKIPSLQERVTEPWFFGCDGSFFSNSFEGEFLGAVRVYTGGKLRILAANAADIFAQLQADVQTAGDGTSTVKAREALLRVLPDLGETDVARAFVAHTRVFHATVEASLDKPVAVLTPPGVLVCTIALNGQGVCGVRISFLPATKHAQKNLKVLQSVYTDVQLQHAADVLSIMELRD